MSAAPWPVEVIEGTAAEIHDRPPSGGPALWWCRPTGPSVVLGSSQAGETLDEAAAERLGLAVARRRSGGAAVVVIPGEMVWLDVVVPLDAVAWARDLRSSMRWFGRAWAAALGGLGIAASHREAGMVRPDVAATVCFAGLGPGEVVDASGAKLVGLSQRRTSSTIRLQSMCHRRWRADRYAALFPALRGTGDLDAVVATVDRPDDEIVAAVAAAVAAADVPVDLPGV